MRLRNRCLAPVIVCLLVAAGRPASSDDRPTEAGVKKKLFQDWVHTEVTIAGKHRTIPREDRMVYQYRADGVSQYLLIGEVSPFRLADELTLDLTANPMQITRARTGEDGKRRVMREIFKFDGDRLVTAVSSKGEFPTGFESTAANGYEVHVFEPESARP